MWAPGLQGWPGNVNLLVHLLLKVGYIPMPNKIGVLLLRNKGEMGIGQATGSPFSGPLPFNLHGRYPV